MTDSTMEPRGTILESVTRLWEQARDKIVAEQVNAWETELEKILKKDKITFAGVGKTLGTPESLTARLVKTATIKEKGVQRVIEAPDYCIAYLAKHMVLVQGSGVCTRENALDAGVLWEPDQPKGAYSHFKDAVKAVRKINST